MAQRYDDDPGPSDHEPSFGLVQIYTGDGKGKTTALLGMAVRAAGWGFRTYIGQFMKGQDYGELRGVTMLAPYVTMEQFGQARFIRADQIGAEDIERVQNGLARVREVLLSGEYQIVALDEICMATYFGLVTVEQVLKLLDERPPRVEIVLTGRRAPRALIERADLVTEMTEVRHPYRTGVNARIGIEY